MQLLISRVKRRKEESGQKGAAEVAKGTEKAGFVAAKQRAQWILFKSRPSGIVTKGTRIVMLRSYLLLLLLLPGQLLRTRCTARVERGGTKARGKLKKMEEKNHTCKNKKKNNSTACEAERVADGGRTGVWRP